VDTNQQRFFAIKGKIGVECKTAPGPVLKAPSRAPRSGGGGEESAIPTSIDGSVGICFFKNMRWGHLKRTKNEKGVTLKENLDKD